MSSWLANLRLRAPHSTILNALVLSLALVQTPDSVPAERLAAREAYRDAKFGMFIHWGVYSLLGNGEWIMQSGLDAVQA